MQKERDTLKLGILTLVVVALFFIVLIWISDRVVGDMQTIVIRFAPSPSMPTLVSGSAILVGGQRVGQVIKAELIPVEGDIQTKDNQRTFYNVEVTAEIFKTITLRKDCSAFADGPPLGGDGLIKIDVGDAAEPFTGNYIHGSEPAGLNAVLTTLQSEFNPDDPNSLLGRIKRQLDPEADHSLMKTLHQSLSDLNVMTSTLSKELGEADKATLMSKIHKVVDNLNDTTRMLRMQFDAGRADALLQKLHKSMDAIDQVLQTTNRIAKRSEGPIENTLNSIEKTTQHIAAQTDPSQTNSLMNQLKITSQKVNAALEDINTVTKTTKDLVVLNRENVNRMLINFKEASDLINTGVKYVLRHPWRLMNPPSANDVKQQAIFDAARNFSQAAARIDDASAQLRVLAEMHDGNIPLDDPDLARIRGDLKKTQDQYRKAEAALWRQLQAN